MKNKLFWLFIISSLLITAIVCHYFFSSLGFNPTDDGYHLAGARRIILGQVPHRDFITIRPPGSFILHAPIVAIGGKYLLLNSRFFVWLELIIISWCWVGVFSSIFGLNFKQNRKLWWMPAVWSIIGLVFSVHSFPIMAWHTVDGIFFSSLGALFLCQPGRKSKNFGYFLIGVSPLFKQNFLLLLPMVWLLSGAWKKKTEFVNSLLLTLPLLIYFLTIIALGGTSDLLLQLSTHSQFNFYKYHELKNFLGLTGFSLLTISSLKNKSSLIRAIALILLGNFFWQIKEGMWVVSNFIHIGSFWLYYCGVGFVLFFALDLFKNWKIVQFASISIVLAVIASISIGYASPALATACLIIFCLASIYYLIKTSRVLNIFYSVLIMIFLILCLKSLFWMRNMGVYRDRVSTELKYDLGNVFFGATGIKTNQNTYLFIQDLQKAIELAGDKPYAVVPDFPAYWMSSPQINPISIDWPQSTELANDGLKERVALDLQSLKNHGVIIVQNIDASRLADGFYPLAIEHYFAVLYTQEHFSPIAKTEYFTIYQ